jgi:hypothetical protein
MKLIQARRPVLHVQLERSMKSMDPVPVQLAQQASITLSPVQLHVCLAIRYIFLPRVAPLHAPCALLVHFQTRQPNLRVFCVEPVTLSLKPDNLRALCVQLAYTRPLWDRLLVLSARMAPFLKLVHHLAKLVLLGSILLPTTQLELARHVRSARLRLNRACIFA